MDNSKPKPKIDTKSIPNLPNTSINITFYPFHYLTDISIKYIGDAIRNSAIAKPEISLLISRILVLTI